MDNGESGVRIRSIKRRPENHLHFQDLVVYRWNRAISFRPSTWTVGEEWACVKVSSSYKSQWESDSIGVQVGYPTIFLMNLAKLLCRSSMSNLSMDLRQFSAGHGFLDSSIGSTHSRISKGTSPRLTPCRTGYKIHHMTCQWGTLADMITEKENGTHFGSSLTYRIYTTWSSRVPMKCTSTPPPPLDYMHMNQHGPARDAPGGEF
ncbi:hypothetical protein VNO77_31139 [Canavalia gladiata]|uniref:Uncharacterized protein n=1 Tax=Canavalia gladiata TaxID=3824 RepID=A0AAN9Q1N4_CANGL